MLFASLFIIIAFSLSVSAEREQRVFDMDLMLTKTDIARIEKAALDAEAEYGCRFYIVTHKADSRFEKYIGEDFIEGHGLSYNDDIVLLIITYDTLERTYYYNMYYYGMPAKRISDGEVNSILDAEDVYDNLKGGNIADGSVAFIERSAKATKMPWVIISLIAVAAALIIGGITVSGITSKYKMKRNPTNYPLEKYAKLRLIDSDDHFLDKHVAVVVTSSGGGGGGRGGGGYGGGRGHAGGR